MQTIDIPKRIRKIRNKLKISQRELAEIITVEPRKVTRQQVADWENRRTRVPADDWEKIKSLDNIPNTSQGATALPTEDAK